MPRSQFAVYTSNRSPAHDIAPATSDFDVASDFPLAPIPSTFPFFKIVTSRFNVYKTERIIVNDRFPITDTTTKVVYLPKVDEIGTDFVAKKLPYSFTSALIDYESERSGMLSSRTNTDSGKFGWKADIIKLFTGESGGEINLEYQKQLSAASSYWLGKQENKRKIVSIEEQLNNECQAKVAAVEFSNFDKPDKVGLTEAVNFVASFNKFIYDALDKYFADARKMNNNR